MNEQPPKRRRGFIGMVERSKKQPDEEQTPPLQNHLMRARGGQRAY
jgi:hypothetical protein